MKTLNERKLAELLEFINKYQTQNGKSPSYRTIMKAMRFTNLASVFRYVGRLEADGKIQKNDCGIKISRRLNPDRTIIATLLGTVTCGQPILAVENIEGIYSLPADIFGTDETFLLHAKGQKDFVFCNDDGTMRTYYGTRTILNRFLRNNNLDKYGIHFHAIRHTFGDVLREKNWSIYKIQKMLRHSKVTTTQIYLSMDENPALDLKNDINEVFDERDEEPENKPKGKNKDFEM